MYVDGRGKVVIIGVPTFDNGPDEFQDGLVRFVKNHKYGFADRNGKIPTNNELPSFAVLRPSVFRRSDQNADLEPRYTTSQSAATRKRTIFFIDVVAEKVQCG